MTIHVGAQSLKRNETQVAVAASQASVAASGRMFFIDHLRVFLTILVVLHHLAITYGGDGSWAYRERPTTELAGMLLTLFMILNQFYFMGLFFLVSGYFVPGAVDRKGNLCFLKDRLVRLGIPLVLCALLVSPGIEYVKAINEGYFSGTLVQFYLNTWQERNFVPGPLWFVEVLLVFSAVYVLGRLVLDWAKRHGLKPAASAAQRPLTQRKVLAFILVLAVLTFTVRLFIHTGTEWNHLELAFFPQYILMFAAGILAYRNRWLPDLPTGLRRAWSIVAPLAIVALPVFMIVANIGENNIAPFKGGLTPQSAFISIFEAVYCVAMSIMLLGLFRLHLDGQGVFGRFLSRNAYGVYIVHPLVIVPLALALSSLSLDPLLKFALLAPLAVVLCFLAAGCLLRRIPYSDRVL